MILRNRGAKTPLLSVDLTPARVALNLRERGAVFPCKWCSVAEIYMFLNCISMICWLKKIYKYRLAKESGVPQTTIVNICSREASIEKYSADTI